MADRPDTTNPARENNPAMLSDLSADMESLALIVRSMHEEVAGFFKLAKSDFWQPAQNYEGAFYFALTELDSKIHLLSDMGTAMEEAHFASKRGEAVN